MKGLKGFQFGDFRFIELRHSGSQRLVSGSGFRGVASGFQGLLLMGFRVWGLGFRLRPREA